MFRELAFGACGEGSFGYPMLYSLDNLKMALERLEHFIAHLLRGKRRMAKLNIVLYEPENSGKYPETRKNLCGNRNKTASDRTSWFFFK